MNTTQELLLKNTLERRLSTRIDVRRDVVIARENSDKFHNAELINHSLNGVCFLSTGPFIVGSRIYIITENQPIDDFNDKYIEAYFADVMWCVKSEDRYRIGAAIVKTDLLDTADSNDVTNVVK